jgi:hypothetical protein
MCLLTAASVLSFPTVLPEEAIFTVTEQAVLVPSDTPKGDLPSAGVESEDADEPVFANAGIRSDSTNEPLVVPDTTAQLEDTEKPALLKAAVESGKEDKPAVLEVEVLEVAEILVFRPSYKYWHNCLERRHKHAHREI